MSNERETLADIERDIRNRADCAERHGDRETHNDGVATLLRSIADRIEAIDSADAWRSLYTPGNAAAMREALVALTDKVLDYLHKGLIQLPLPLENATAKARAALSAPARQCDVGTAEEQVVRFRDAMVHECLADEYCRCKDAARCFAQWTQLPYDAKEGAGK